MPTLLVTRPTAQAQTTQQQLQAQGYNCLMAPMLRIVPTNAPYSEEGYTAILFTSQNAPDMLAATTAAPGIDRTLPCYCVGEMTAQAARNTGFINIITSNGDSKNIANKITSTANKPIKLLHIAGEDVTTSTYVHLNDAGCDTIIWTVYKAETVNSLPDNVVQAIENQKLDGALFYSSRSAEQFIKLAQTYNITDKLTHIHAFALSHAVAEKLQPYQWRGLTAAQSPSEDALVAEICHRVPAHRT